MSKTIEDLTTRPQVRDFDGAITHTRDAETDAHTLNAIGVPYDVEINLWEGWREKFAPGSIDDDGAILRYGHAEPIGLVTKSEETGRGREITARLSHTPRGEEVATLIADGVLTRMSIGFDGLEHTITERDDGTTLITWTKVKAREYSVVEFPAYNDAEITGFRNQQTSPIPMEGNTVDTIEDQRVGELRDNVADMQTAILEMRQTLAEGLKHEDAPALDQRSAAQFLRDLVAGDATTRETANDLRKRAFEGTTINADPLADVPVFVRDLVRLIDNANPLKNLFATDGLPSTGMKIEYAELEANTIQVAQQKAEGDKLVTGKLSIATKTTDILTYGGYTELSRQTIERSPLNITQRHINGMGLAAGAAAADAFAAFYAETVKTRASSALSVGKTVNALKWQDINSIVVDAAAAYTDLAMPMHGLIVDKETFKGLTSLTDSNDRPLFIVEGSGVNAIGTANPESLAANLAGVKLVPNFRQKTPPAPGIVGAFYNSDALRTYQSPVATLQDGDITALTNLFSVYFYAAFAAEIPAALVPLKLGA